MALMSASLWPGKPGVGEGRSIAHNNLDRPFSFCGGLRRSPHKAHCPADEHRAARHSQVPRRWVKRRPRPLPRLRRPKKISYLRPRQKKTPPALSRRFGGAVGPFGFVSRAGRAGQADCGQLLAGHTRRVQRLNKP
jgi:hypothetical protein